MVPIARIFVVGVDVVMGCAFPEFAPKRLKISIRPAERACFIYLLHNVRRLVAQSLLLSPARDRPIQKFSFLLLNPSGRAGRWAGNSELTAKAARNAFGGQSDESRRPPGRRRPSAG